MHKEVILDMRRDQLTMSYFDNLDNEPLNKYKKPKNRKKFIDAFFYLYIDGHSNFM
jgi:hypothetical protein